MEGAGIAQSVYRRATGWTAGVLFPAGVRDFSPFRRVQTHPAFSGGKVARDVKLTTHLHVVPRSRMVKVYLHSAIRLHGVVRK
jgi:hypothetical protein